tara:strand:+ start:35091 stop:35633 length:543 start_codon:yes stop_codon:yes gene_type:complete
MNMAEDCKDTRPLAQLAVLAATPVEAGTLPVGIANGLTDNTGSCAGQGAAARIRDFVTAFGAIFGGVSGRHIGSSAFHCVRNRVVDLILYRAIARPTACHRKLQFFSIDKSLSLEINEQQARWLPSSEASVRLSASLSHPVSLWRGQRMSDDNRRLQKLQSVRDAFDTHRKRRAPFRGPA